MGKIFSIIAIFLGFSLNVVTTPCYATELEIEINRIKHFNKPIYIRIVAVKKEDMTKTALPNTEAAKSQVLPQSKTETVLFSNINEGDYVIQMFQDLNANAVLDTTDNGYPAEPYALSNNPILFENPKIEEFVIRVQGAKQKERIGLRERKKRRRGNSR